MELPGPGRGLCPASPACASPGTDGPLSCSVWQLLFGAVKLNINRGNGSHYTSQQGYDSWREIGPGCHPTALVTEH